MGSEPGGRQFRAGVVLLALGALLSLGAALALWTPLHGALRPAIHDVPGTFEQRLDPGRHNVLALAGTTRSFGVVTVTQTERVGAGRIVVRDPDGDVVPLTAPSFETITRGSRIFQSVAAFRATTGGRYSFRVEGTDTSQVLVARSLGDWGERLAAGIAAGVLGSLLLVVGGVLAVLGWSKRRDARRRAAMPPPPRLPDGWVPPPPPGLARVARSKMPPPPPPPRAHRRDEESG